MHWVDATIFILYMVAMLSVGYYFLRRNKTAEDYYVSGRNMTSWHIGLSVVATDVGGGFSIGLGGLGFIMGLSGSWMLFTGLLGAWLSAVFLIPRVFDLARDQKMLTFPQIFKYFYGPGAALTAGIISCVGYMGFTGSQILAGAKLASASFVSLDLNTAIILMGAIAIIYTVIGGLKAVIYTDTFQWIILMLGLVGIGIPMSYAAVGGWEAIKATIDPSFFSLGNVSFVQLFNWGITILPIWFVGMTLYQRIYACRDEATAKRAWKIAGFFEWPMMAFMGVILGLLARVAADQGMFIELGYRGIGSIDAEMGLPLLLRTILPYGLMGLMLSAYFSAILSTADSCLMAASGNLTTDILGKWLNPEKQLRISQLTTFGIGFIALLLASNMENVLELMLYSYAFMVSGLLVPLIAAVFFKKSNNQAAVVAMLVGGGCTLILQATEISLPLGLDANFFGISASLISFVIVDKLK